MKECVDCLQEHNGLEEICEPCLNTWEEESKMKEIECKSCRGTGIDSAGYGLDPDWCGKCGGNGADWVKEEVSK